VQDDPGSGWRVTTAILAEVRREIPDLRQREVNWVTIKFDLPNPLH
jgi:hypothetical protein